MFVSNFDETVSLKNRQGQHDEESFVRQHVYLYILESMQTFKKDTADGWGANKASFVQAAFSYRMQGKHVTDRGEVPA